MTYNDGKVVLSSSYLKKLRRQYGLSQEGLAYRLSEEKLSISIATVKRVEAGKIVNYGTAYKLAKFFGIKVIELITDEIDQEEKKTPASDSVPNHSVIKKSNH